MQNIKFDPEVWLPFSKGEKVAVRSEFYVKLEKPGSLKANEVLVGYGTEFKVSCPYPVEIVASEAGVLFERSTAKVVQEGVPLTNMDKRPGLSSVERMIKSAFKEKDMREALERIARREADKKLQAERVKQGLQDENPLEEEEPADDDDQEPEPTPQKEPEPNPAA